MPEEALRERYSEAADRAVIARPTAPEKSLGRVGPYVKFGKRAFDLVFALVGIVFAIPVIALFALLVVLESKGPAFYLQERVGLGGTRFNVIKLRSMVSDAEKDGARWADKNDARITKVGSFIRKTRIDELPQLINVIKGEMSVVGPRPERALFTNRFNKEIPGFVDRLQVKPGLTGWAQVNGGYDITPQHKLKLDMEYIGELSWRKDFIILLKTVKVVLTGEGAR